MILFHASKLMNKLKAHCSNILFLLIKDKIGLENIVYALHNTHIVFGGPNNRVFLGKNVNLVNALLNVSSGEIHIGDDTFFGHNVLILTGSHPLSEKGIARQSYPLSGRDIHIGQGVWIASGSIVIGPCVIGDNVVVAAGSVVNRGVLEAGYLYAGVPAKKKHKLLS